MAKYRIIFVSKDTKFKFSREFTDSYNELHPNVEFNYVQNNVSPLATVYNIFLNEPETSEYDYVVLLHADVWFNIDDFIEHIDSVHGKYDVIGLCGCSKFSVKQTPLNWWNGSKPYPYDRWGCVTHGELGNHVSYFSEHSPHILDHAVACIDGLCIVFTKHAVESGLRFDETLGPFDFYDTDISLQAILKYNLKLGVIVQKDLQHYSVGKSIMTSHFYDSEVKFRKKWNF